MNEPSVASNQAGADPQVERDIQRLQRRWVVELEQMQRFHQWLDEKRTARQPCRVVGDSRTGKTIACDTYRLKHPPTLISGQPPHIPVVSWQSPPDSGNRDLFEGILQALRYQLNRGTLSEIRSRVYRTLKACQVEMLIVDEAHRLRPRTFSELQDILDVLQIAIVLVGTDRLDAVMRRDEQVYRRFIASHRYERLTSTQLVETSAIWETHVLRLPEPSNLGSAKMQKILGPVTGGYLGLLDRILRESAVRSLSRGLKRVEFSILNEVAAECR
ncbi:TniB family NTP-binding protein [Cyanobacteria bacterium FACHB-63]|nr:TniB family NTP-binding protein [Cyanobacteria bacterium FACHB-63]